MNRFPIAFAQTVAFAAACASISWQVLRLLIHRGSVVSTLGIALIIAGSFAAGALMFGVVLIPLRKRLGSVAPPGRYSTPLLILQIAISTVWVMAWAFPGFQFVGMGGTDVFWGFFCFSMGGLSGALFYEPIGSSRTPI